MDDVCWGSRMTQDPPHLGPSSSTTLGVGRGQTTLKDDPVLTLLDANGERESGTEHDEAQRKRDGVRRERSSMILEFCGF